ncbi:MAG: hypothetical protein N3H31_05010 [Candidatus Nezhaarchaeota archaeon]|nr:hypothetical protein [Candidatus Nezhaarchaeota archaeon]
MVRVVVDKKLLEDVIEGRVKVVRGRRLRLGRFKILRVLTPKKWA